MSTFTCQTCSLTSDDIGKHLSSTRHKKVTFDALQETVECEECEDSNIHILSMLRYGLSDLSLLCAGCCQKSDTPATAEYTLANGSLISKLPQYYKFRDIQCNSCGTDRKLAVGTQGGSQVIMCSGCIAKQNLSSTKFVSEDSDDFLYALLGIKEYISKPGSKSKLGGRKLGRKGGRDRKPKPFDPDAERRKAHYESEKATRMSFKSEKTMKAVGSTGVSPNISRAATPARPQNSKNGKSVSMSKTSSKASAKPSSKVSTNSKNTAPTNGLHASTQTGPKGEAPKRNIQSADVKNIARTSGRKEDKATKSGSKQSLKASPQDFNRKVGKDLSTVSEKHLSTEGFPGNNKSTRNTFRGVETSKLEKPEENSIAPKKVQAKKDTNPKSKPPTSTSAKTSAKASAKPSAKASAKTKPGKTERSDLSKKSSNKGEPRNSANIVSDVTSNQSKKSDARKADTTETELAVQKKTEMKLPPGIFKHIPSPKPKLTYESMEEYFNEMCYNLFLEEKMSIHTSQKVILSPEDFELEWYADQDKKHKQFKLNVLMTPEFLDRYLSKKMQNLKKNPFMPGQSLILMLGDDIPWYGNIVLVDTKSSNPKKGKPKRGRSFQNDNSPKLLEIIVELYKWNKMPLPVTTDVKLLKVLPVSVPVSRVFTAMSRISNPRFIDMLLGKTPIRQIFFKNYLKFSRDSFNESQRVAVQSVMNNSITVLQGPPGTGKTSTIYEVILQLLENLNTYPILVVAASNIAIDNIAEKLLPKHGNSILRIVSMEKEPEYNREHPLASICLHHRVYDGMPANLQESIREMRRPNSKLSQSQYKKLLTSQISYSDKIIASSRVIFTTTVVAGGNQLKPIAKMPVVIMDEATQSSEPTTLIPLSMNGVEKFVFVGDQKQLSSFSQVPNLSLSLFERILSNGTYKTPHMLDTQYRMHPAISKFPREKFYGGLLKDGLTPEDRQKNGIPANPVVFWDTCGKHQEGTVFSRFREDSGLTYANKGEVDFVQKTLMYLIYEKNIKKSDIGVITPYRGQRDLISSVLVKNDLINPEKDEVHVEVDREDFFNDSKPVTIHTVSDIMIASIDAFQGREKDFLIMSCVRSNKQNKIGFLSDARRMNVALTRAKYGLVLIGDVECLRSSDALWREYIDSLEGAGSIKKGMDFQYD